MPYGDCICEVPGCIGPCVTRAKSLNEKAPELSPYETMLELPVKCPYCNSQNVKAITLWHYRCNDCGVSFAA